MYNLLTARSVANGAATIINTTCEATGEVKMSSAEHAIKRLREGNERFVNATLESSAPESRAELRRRLAGGQSPFAVILGCADSRVPVSTIFDQRPGDLFVVRVAGNVWGPTQLGSVEFAVDQLGAGLLVVLGHSGCGAVGATLGALANPKQEISPNLKSIVDQIGPHVAHLLHEDPDLSAHQRMEHAVKANARGTVARTGECSELLAEKLADGSLTAVAAEYSLESGVVTFL